MAAGKRHRQLLLLSSCGQAFVFYSEGVRLMSRTAGSQYLRPRPQFSGEPTGG
jgi:hypothetical protein